MKQAGLMYFSDIHLTAIGLLIFFMFFMGVLFWVNRKSSIELYNRLEQIPLKDGE